MELSNALIMTFVFLFLVFLSYNFVISLSVETEQAFDSPVMTNFQTNYNASQASLMNRTKSIQDKLANQTDQNPVSSFIMGFSALYEIGIQIFDFATFIPDLFGSVMDTFGMALAGTEILDGAKTFFALIIGVFVVFGVINFFRGMKVI